MYDLINASLSEVHGEGDASGSADNVDTARILVSMVVNLMATLCIAVKAWYDGLENFIVLHSHHAGNSGVA